MSTVVHLGRVGVRTAPGGLGPDLVVEPMFPPLYGKDPHGKDPHGKDPRDQGARAAQQEVEPAVADPLQRYVWLRGKTVDQARALQGVEAAWSEAPPCAHPAFDLDQGSTATDADDRVTRALAALHQVGRGEGVKVAVIERAWSELAAVGAVVSRGLPDDRWAEAVAEFGPHGDRTVATLRGAPTGLAGVAPGAAIGLFSPLALDASGGVYDDLGGAIVRAAQWLGVEPPGCLGQILGGWARPAARGVLLVELQTFLLEPQVLDLPAEARERWCPGGRAAAGPVDADPGIRAVLGEVVRAGHVVVVPAGNGRRDLRQVHDGPGAARLDGDGHPGLRVGACHADGRVAGSNFGAGAVEVCAPGHAVRAAVVRGGAWEEARWGGTSAASALIAGAAACLVGRMPAGAVRQRLLDGVGVEGIGVRPSFFG